MKKFIVHKGEGCDVYVPSVEDKSEQKDLMDMAIESGKTPLKRERPVDTSSKSDKKEMIRELRKFKERQQQVNTRKYY